MGTNTNKQISTWLISACILIFVMVIIGGITRHTGSGLSMVEWHPISGIIPPITDNAWELEFEKYQQSPQYKKLNQGMTLPQYKFIFFWEYIHRLIGRLLAVFFILPFCWFFIKKKLCPQLIKKLLIMFLFGGLQGLYGWYMVKSGLIDNPYVSHYRLAGHLILAFMLMAYILWIALEINQDKFTKGTRYSKEHFIPVMRWIITLIMIQIIYGAFTAGLKAGYGWNTFPKMTGQWIPEGLLPSPWWINLFEHDMTVQFIHRMLGWGLCVLIPGFWRYTKGFELNAQQDCAITTLLIIVIVQFLIGMFTLLWVVPLWIGVLHQAGACILLMSSVYTYFLIINVEEN